MKKYIDMTFAEIANRNAAEYRDKEGERQKERRKKAFYGAIAIGACACFLSFVVWLLLNDMGTFVKASAIALGIIGVCEAAMKVLGG